MFVYSLKLAWWNVALSPAAPQAKTKANAETYLSLSNHIISLFTDYSCDFLALCEVSSTDVEYFRTNLPLTGIEFLDLSNDVGRTRFDVAVIYNKNKIDVRTKYQLSKIKTGNTIKAAQLIEVENLEDSTVISIFLCHWSSRRCGDGDLRRKSAADIVYSSAIELMNNDEDVIIMGDFNDNPYDDSLLHNLNATRCHDAVMKYPKEYFYNPFWRSVVSERKYNHSSGTGPFRSGTHRYKQFLGTVWHSYDQIIVSGSFLGTGTWHLNEDETKVLSQGQFVVDFESSKSICDHLPIICEIMRP